MAVGVCGRTGQTCEQVAEFMGIEHNCDDCSEQSPWSIGETPEGFMEAASDDWIFEATYEPADEGTETCPN